MDKNPCFSEKKRSKQFDSLVMLANEHASKEESTAHHAISQCANFSVPLYLLQLDATLGKKQHAIEHITPTSTRITLSPTYLENASDLAKQLHALRIFDPIFLIYNPAFYPLIERFHAPLRVFHALCDAFQKSDPPLLLKTLQQCDVLITPTTALEKKYLLNMRPNTKSFLETHIEKIPTLLNTFFEDTTPQKETHTRFNILVLYAYESSCTVSAIKNHLNAFKKYSNHYITYVSAYHKIPSQKELNTYHAIIVHYTARLLPNYPFFKLFKKHLQNYYGLKILFIQDEYNSVRTIRKHILQLRFHIVFTNIPLEDIHKIYPSDTFKHVTFIRNLTGYVEEDIVQHTPILPLEERAIDVCYRARHLSALYGQLGQEKTSIGLQFKAFCQKNTILKEDISVSSEAMIFNNSYYSFLSNSRCCLGTESGSNVFDIEENIQERLDEALKKDPSLSYTDLYQQYVQKYEVDFKMNQISPKIFEAINLRTALILFEGNYSNIIKENEHYISLKKDFSNIEEVVQKMRDLNYLQAMTDRAYKDIVESKTYSYKTFMQCFDSLLHREIKKTTDYPGIFPARQKEAQFSSALFQFPRKLFRLSRYFLPKGLHSFLKKKLLTLLMRLSS